MSTESGMVLVPREFLDAVKEMLDDSGGWTAKRLLDMLAAAPASPPTPAVDGDQLGRIDVLTMISQELGSLIPDWSAPNVDDWPCSERAQRVALQSAYRMVRGLLSAEGERYGCFPLGDAKHIEDAISARKACDEANNE